MVWEANIGDLQRREKKKTHTYVLLVLAMTTGKLKPRLHEAFNPDSNPDYSKFQLRSNAGGVACDSCVT